MKKIVLMLMVVTLLVGCSAGGSKETLKVYSWGEYIDPQTIIDFENEYDVRVIYDVFASNEEMYTKLQSGETYDILVPSDYMIQRLIEEDRLETIDLDLISHYENLLESTKNKDYDPNNEYSVPFFIGDVGIIYNTEKVDSSDVESQEWEVLRNEKYKGQIYMYDSERDSFMLALKALGFSANTTNENEIQQAFAWLNELDDTMSPVYAGDEIIDQVINGAKDMAVMYSGDATYMISENENLAYYVPTDMGTNIWQDSMVILKGSENVEFAHKWMDFMISNDAATLNTEYVGYTSPVESVFNSMIEEEGAFEGISSYVPSVSPNHEEFYYDKENVELLSDLWFRVKAGN